MSLKTSWNSLNSSLSTRTKGEIALLVATFFWGFTFPFVRIVIQELSPLQLVFTRGIVASFFFLPFVIFIKKNRRYFFKLLPVGLLLGCLYFISYLAQAIGLQTIHSGRSAFITNLSVIFVPLFSPLFKRGLPTRNDFISCVIATCGIYFLSDPFSHSGINIGDLWTLLTAICFSLQIHVLQWAIERKPNALLYAYWQVTFIFVFSLVFMPFAPAHAVTFPLSSKAAFALLYLAVVAMVITTWIQTRFQGYTSPERASVIYIVEPIFASFFGYLILNESMSAKSLFGGFLIILAVIWSYLFNYFKKYKINRL